MPEKRFLWIALIASLVLTTGLFTFFLQPAEEDVRVPERVVQSIEVDEKDDTQVKSEVVTSNSEIEDVEELVTEGANEGIENVLSNTLQSIKSGKSSVLNLVFSETDLNQAIKDLLALADEDEPWVNYALGQIVDTCGELHQRSEPELIEMFSSMNTSAMPPQQQSTLSELLPIVVGASKRCRSIDKDLLAGLGGDARSWFRTGAEAGDANSYVTSGFTLLNEELKAQSEEYQNAKDDERWKVGKVLREEARKQFRDNMRNKLEQGALTPELLVNMSEHLNLFYDEKQEFKQREAWILAACDMGYENNCNTQSTAVQLMCMFQDSCQSGTDYQQGVLWAQGQFKLDEYQQTANELRRIIESKAWDELGF